MRSSIHSRSERTRAAGALAAVMLLLAPGVARATAPGTDDVAAQARQRFTEGTLAYDLGEFHKALEAYSEAYRLVAKPGLLFNVAQCHRQLGQYERAAFFYRRFLYLAGQDAPDAALARELLAEAEEKARAASPAQPGAKQEVARAPVKREAPVAPKREPPRDAPVVAERPKARDVAPRPVDAPPASKAPSRAQAAAPAPALQPQAQASAPASVLQPQAAALAPAGEVRGEPLTRKWWVWAGAGAVALLAGGLVYAATAPEPRGTTLGNLPRR
jgi:tetratricopeptide (TPR) repeat protein